MKKRAIAAICVFLLTGCNADSETERAMALRSELLKAPSSGFQTELTADYGDKSYSFSMDCRFDQMGNMAFQVSAPESIAGIRGSVEGTAGALVFEETVLHFEPIADKLPSPAAAPWILMNTLRSGRICSVCQEEEFLLLSMDDSYEENALRLDIRLNRENVPVYGEILWNNRKIMSMHVSNFVFS